MIIAACIVAVLILISLLRIGVSAEYGGDGFFVTASVGLIKIKILPRKEKPRKAKKIKKPKKPKKPKQPKMEKPGGLKAFLDMLPGIKSALGRLRRRLLIKKLTIHYTAAGEDPVKTAMTFGAANAVFGVIVPVLENNFRIKHRDFRAQADFNATQQLIYVNAAISLAVWEAIYIAAALAKYLPRKSKELKKESDQKRKDVQQ
ncbi:MAG: DUF2953 domain-containing protein [Oscillospiraceae bacterium]|nr:DUF2953 domain-containing protein [Oscillospiraceae bacterium]